MRYPDACCEVDPKERSNDETTNSTKTVEVCWFDGYIEEFEVTEVKYDSDFLRMLLKNEKNRYIPLCSVRWFGAYIKLQQEK